MMDDYFCECERGGDCTRTSMCAIQTALEDQAWEYEQKIERLSSEVSELRAVYDAAQAAFFEREPQKWAQLKAAIDAVSGKQRG